MKRIRYGVKYKDKEAPDSDYKFEMDDWTGRYRFFYSINKAFEFCNDLLSVGNDAIVEELPSKGDK